MIENLIAAAESAATDIQVKIFECAIMIGKGDTIEAVSPLAKIVSDTRKALDQLLPANSFLSSVPQILRDELSKITPVAAVYQMFRIVKRVVNDIDMRLSGALSTMRSCATVDDAFPIAKELSSVKKALLKDRILRQFMALHPTCFSAPISSRTYRNSDGASILSPRTYSAQHTPTLGNAQTKGDRLSTDNTLDRAQETRTFIIVQINELRSKFKNIVALFKESKIIGDSVRYAKLLSDCKKELDRIMQSVELQLHPSTDDFLTPPPNSIKATVQLYESANQTLRDSLSILEALQSVVKDCTQVSILLKISYALKDALLATDDIRGNRDAELRPSTSRPTTQSFGEHAIGVPDTNTSLKRALYSLQENPADVPDRRESTNVERESNIYLLELRSISNSIIKEVNILVVDISQKVKNNDSLESAIFMARSVNALLRVLSNHSNASTLQKHRRYMSCAKFDYVPVVLYGLIDVRDRLQDLTRSFKTVTTLPEAIHFAKILKDVKMNLDNMKKAISEAEQDVTPLKASKSFRQSVSPETTLEKPKGSTRQPLQTTTDSSTDVLPDFDAGPFSLEALISQMRQICGDTSESKDNEGTKVRTKAQRIAKIHEQLMLDEEELKKVHEVEKEVEATQQKLMKANVERHKLTLAVRNLDRKINIFVRAQKMEDEDTDEIYQFFDETVRTDHPLGSQKEYYEQLVFLLRQDPHYITSMMPHISHEEVDTIAQTINNSLFSDIFLYREEAMLLKIIKSVMEKSFEKCNDAHNFLRSNSLVTKLMSGYTRRQSGRLHLHDIFAKEMEKLFRGDTNNLELDPRKVLTEIMEGRGKTIDDATPADLQESEKLADENSGRLQQFCASFLSSIISKRHSMPFGIRWLAKEMIRLARLKFPKLTEKDDSIMVGSFIFLRFVMPAIMAPEGMGLNGKTIVTARQRRNLVLCSKVLQNLANNVDFGEKEPFMAKVNPFMEQSRPLIFEYFKFLIDVVEPEEYYHLLAEASSKSSLSHRTVTITPNELFALHRILLHLHSEVVKSEEDPMMLLLMKMGPPRELFPKNRNKYMMLEVLSTEGMNWMSSQAPSGVKIMKDKLISALRGCSQLPPSSANESLLCILGNIHKALGREAAAEIEDIVSRLQSAPKEVIDIFENDLIAETEREMTGRQMFRESLFKEKEELLSALEQQNLLVEEMRREKRIFAEYFANIQKTSFVTKIRASPDRRIGPFVYNLKDMEKCKLLEKPPVFEGKPSITLELSSNTPGSVQMVVKVCSLQN
eukprot:TRINITY_DN5130_c0_g1_i7.p1 TRINITY_DN5130_c0_g1~~TRINITY_DN5130_c0_g1_i7.p1  ORF type:complete len:1262 (-),score=247.21 TRINITY_DN5130_c0_g1_i7:451-4236(-)